MRVHVCVCVSACTCTSVCVCLCIRGYNVFCNVDGEPQCYKLSTKILVCSVPRRPDGQDSYTAALCRPGRLVHCSTAVCSGLQTCTGQCHFAVCQERKVPGSNPASAGIFSGSSHTSDLNIGTPVATLPGAWRYRVSTGTGRPGVSIL